MPEHDVETVVVGAGIAELATAWRLRHREVVVLERADRVGGRICSERRGDYWLNFGAHVFAGPESATGRLLDEVGVAAVPVPGELAAIAMNGRVITDGRVNTYPFRIPMPWEARLTALRAGAKVRVAVWRYGRAASPRPGDRPGDLQQRVYDFLGEQTFADFVGPLPPEVDAMFRPTVMRSSGLPEQMSAGAGVGYFRLVWDRKSGLSRNIVGGSSVLPETLHAELGPRVMHGCEVGEVVSSGDGVSVRYEQGGRAETIRTRHCVLATPAPVSRQLGAGVASETRAALERVVYGPYVSAAFLTNETESAPWDECYAIATPKRAFNVFFNMTSVPRAQERERRPGSSIMVFSPAELAQSLLELDDAQIIAAYLRDIEAIFPGFSELVSESKVRRFPEGVPYCFPGRGKLQAALTRPQERVHLAGDFLGTFYTDTAIESGWRAAGRILEATRERRD
ncbi:MAG: FAD-dependent oxidoreductase [Solirubrobacterales bacterium]|nr:FAD-dependent oxidoreductase [Solirubrobacterales bacterium]